MHPAYFPLNNNGSYKSSYCHCAFTVMGSSKYYPNVFGASLPFFTPTQALQTVYNFIDAAFDFHTDHAVHMRPLTVTEAVFSAASQPPGEPWMERTIVTMPKLRTTFLLGAVPEWLFVYDARRDSRPESKTRWAFVRCEPRSRDEATGESESSASETEEDQRAIKLRFTYKIYDVRGFVRTAVEQGRPPPPEDIVTNLEHLLNGRRHGKKPEAPEDFSEPFAMMKLALPETNMEDLSNNLVQPIRARFRHAIVQVRDAAQASRHF